MSAAVTPLSERVARAIDELAASFSTTVEPTGDGGAIVEVHGLEIGPGWRPNVIDLTFLIPVNYPFAAIYPYYTAPGLTRVDGRQEPGLQQVAWRGSQRTQISLRANRWSPQVDTALGAVLQVQQWFHR